MASSDNVVRGGLTPKHVDLDELMAIVRFEAQAPELLGSTEEDGERRFDAVADEFELAVMTLDGKASRSRLSRGAEILLCAAGEGRWVATGSASAIPFRSGEALFVPAAAESYHLEGDATVFRASLPEAERTV